MAEIPDFKPNDPNISQHMRQDNALEHIALYLCEMNKKMDRLITLLDSGSAPDAAGPEGNPPA